MSSRTELITILLQNYEDVLNGLRDTKGTGEHIPLMCAAWNHPSYQQLEQLLRTLRTQSPNLHQHIVGTYLHPHHQRTMTCPHCKLHFKPWNHPPIHTHGRRTIALVPAITRHTPAHLNPNTTRHAIQWLDQHWQGTISLPDELAHLAA